jgi:hypothetical protein
MFVMLAAASGLLYLSGCGDSDSEQRAGNSVPVTDRSVGNAADAYRAAYGSLGEQLIEQLRGVEGLGTVDESLARQLENHQTEIGAVMDASRLGHCDFGVDYSDGYQVVFDHLPQLHTLARLLDADAIRLVEEGDRSGAADRLGAIVRVVRHLGSGETILVKLVGFGCLQRATETIEECLDREAIDRAGRRALLEELTYIDLQDPLGAKSAVSFEREMAVHAIQTARTMEEIFIEGGEGLPVLHREAAAEEAEEAFRQVEEVWDRPGAVQAIERIQDQMREPVAQYTLAGLSGYREQVTLLSERLQRVIERLKR